MQNSRRALRRAYPHATEDEIKVLWAVKANEISERQWYDVLGVMKVRYDVLDRAYLQRWAAEPGLTDLLERALEDAGV